MPPSTPDGARLLTPPQRAVIDSGLLASGFHCILQMPTGSGKTWLAEQAIGETLARGHRALFLTPLRALAAELVARWTERFAPARVGVFTGDFGSNRRPPVAYEQARLLVMTPERLDLCTRSWRDHWEWIPEVDLAVIDEFHLLGDPERGPRLEGTLSRFERLNPFARFIGLSATLGNRAELADWLGGVEFGSDWRPVPLRWRVVRYRRAADKASLLIEEVAKTTTTGGQVLVFVQSRRRAEELGQLLANAGHTTDHHHAGLDADERRGVEERFRSGRTRALVATATLEMGLNLPARQVILYDLQRFDGTDYGPLPVNSIWQRAGRAGRPGLDPFGEVVLLAPAWEAAPDHYLRGCFEPVKSGLANRRALAEQIVAETASGLARTESQVRAVFARSLAARQERLPNVSSLIRDMITAGLLESVRREDHTGERLRPTRLGRIASRHLLDPQTVLDFRRVIEFEPSPTYFDLLLICSAGADCQPITPVDFEELDELGERLAHERSRLLTRPPAAVAECLDCGGKRLLAAMKMALTLRDWTRCGDARAVADRNRVYPFEVARLRESAERLLIALGATCAPEPGAPTTAPDDTVTLAERARTLRVMVAVGLDEEAVTLTFVGGIGAKLARRLVAAGITDIEALAQAESNEIAGVRGVSSQRAARWIEEAERLVRTRSAWRLRETDAPLARLIAREWPAGVDPYRLRRACELRVAEADGGYRVSGGLEPHRVTEATAGFACDCPDASAGHMCKHQLAVRLFRQEPALVNAAQQLRDHTSDGWDMHALWWGGERRSS
jgi:helicase